MLTAGSDSKERVKIRQAIWTVNGAHAPRDVQQIVLYTLQGGYR